jgi:hypothetical protein
MLRVIQLYDMIVTKGKIVASGLHILGGRDMVLPCRQPTYYATKNAFEVLPSIV